MEGSYDPVFSGPSTPMSPSAPSVANQYKANVNRTKTRKWVEAKTIDYGGDDWGGDYDDEPDEPEQQPQPPPKPQGPRPSTTFSNSQPPSPAGPRPIQTTGLAAPSASPAVSLGPGLKTPVGAPTLRIQTQQHPAAQPATADTESPWRQRPPSRGNSPGAERPREISPHAVGVPQSSNASSVYSAVEEFGQFYGDRGASPGPFQGPRPRRMSPGPQSASSPMPTRFPGRKSSLGQHDGPADNIQSTNHGDNARQLGSRPGSSHTNASSIMSPNKPWMVEGTVGGPRSASPSGSMKSPPPTGKALPFVRPADIYKKLEEEKEKVRRSMDSGRPSMDSLGLGRGSDTASSLRTQSPAGTSRNKQQTQEQGPLRPDSDVISPGLVQVTDVPFTEEVQVDSNGRKGTMPGRDDDDSIAPRSSRPGLPTVAERKSEYGIEGLIASYEARGGTPTGTSQPGAFPLAATAESASVPASRDTVPAISSPTSRPSARNEIVGEQVEQGHSAAEAPELEKKAGAAQDKAFGSGHSQEKAVEEAQRGEEGAEIKKEQSGEELRRLSTSPKLPELGRLSVFGFDLFSSSTSSDAPTSSSFNLPGTSPPPPVPALPSAHSIVSPSSPLSTVIESPSPSSAQSAPAHDDLLEQAQEGQRSRDPAGPVFNEGTQLPTAPNAIPTEDSAGSSAASSDVVPTQPNARHTEPSHGEYGSPSGNSSPDLDPASARPGGATDLPQRAESPATSITNLHAPSRSLTSKSESEHQPSVEKALPALPSEVSVVTPDPQASQLGISAPVAIARDDPGSFEGEGQPTSDSKLALHPLLAQHAQQAKAIPPQVGTSTSFHATSASVRLPAIASKLTPVDNQVLPPPDLPGSLATDYDSYIQSSSTDDAAVPSSQTADNGRSDGGNVEPPTPKARLGEDTSTDTTPLHPSTAPPPPPVEITRGETYVTAVESPSGLEDEGSPIKSDKLSAEILRSLSPGAPKPTTATVESPGGGNRLTDKPSGAARESSFLPDLYDDYWSFAGTGNAADANAAPDVPVNPTSDAVPAALKVHADDPRPASLIVAKDDTTHTQSPPPSLPGATPRSSVDVFKTDVEAKTVELHRPVLRNRFSWERDGVEAAKIDVQVEPKSLSAKQDTSSTIDTHPAEIPAADVAASTSAEPMVKQPRAPSPSPAFEVENKAVTDNRSKSPTGSVQPNSPVLSPAVSDPVPEIGPDHVHLHPGPLSSNPVLTWQEIMAVPSQTDRIGELNKARAHYAAAETGLPTILENFASMHPDIVDARLAGGPTSPVYAYNAPTDQDAGGLLSPTALGTTPTIASRHHSNPTAHIGAKSKELFATAGKASKGFFSTLKAKGKKVAN